MQKPIRGAAGAFRGDGQNPNDAKRVNPLDGSNLMRESRGFIRTLFPAWDLIANIVQNTTLQPGNYRIPAAGNSITFFRVTGVTSSTNMAWRLWKNNAPVTDWIPFRYLSIMDYILGEPISPFGGPNAAFNAPMQPANYTLPPIAFQFGVEFDMVEIQTDTAMSLNAFITDGAAALGIA